MVTEKRRLEGKVAIVTGAGTGLGKAMALTLAKAGADIVAAARRVPLIEQTVAEVRALGRRGLAIPADVTDSKQVNEMVERALGEMGRIDILINNAGIVRGEQRKAIWDISNEEWHRGIDTNLTGAFYCCRAVGKYLVAQRSGKVINISSGYGLRGGRDNYMYCCAKAAIILLTRSLALTWAQDDVQVNCLAPGFIDTTGEAAIARGGQFIPVGRLGVPQDIASMALFLASEASDYITGELFIVDGGALAGGYVPTGYAPLIPLKEV